MYLIYLYSHFSVIRITKRVICAFKDIRYCQHLSCFWIDCQGSINFVLKQTTQTVKMSHNGPSTGDEAV